VHEAVEGTAFQPAERRILATPAVEQAAGVAHAVSMPTVCTHDPVHSPMKRSTGQGVCPAAIATHATKANNLIYIIDLLYGGYPLI